MKNKQSQNDMGINLSTKWIFVIIIALVLGFGVYGYFTVKKWVHHTAIERQEKPITGYTITKVYSDLPKSKKNRSGYADDDVEKDDYEYYMDVMFKGKNYKLEIPEYIYNDYNKQRGITLYYDSKNDEVFVANTGGGNLLATALGLIFVLIIALILLIKFVIKSIKKKNTVKRPK